MTSAIILGSSRKNGDTRMLAEAVAAHTDAVIIDLLGKDIHHYDYEYRHMDDDFIPTIEQILPYDHLIFATPIYWYAMSGILKTFFDRMTDLIKVRKDLGYQLKGKTLSVISCASDETIPEGFEVPFRNTAEYLGMTYGSHVHGWVEEGNIPDSVAHLLATFAKNETTRA